MIRAINFHIILITVFCCSICLPKYHLGKLVSTRKTIKFQNFRIFTEPVKIPTEDVLLGDSGHGEKVAKGVYFGNVLQRVKINTAVISNIGELVSIKKRNSVYEIKSKIFCFYIDPVYDGEMISNTFITNYYDTTWRYLSNSFSQIRPGGEIYLRSKADIKTMSRLFFKDDQSFLAHAVNIRSNVYRLHQVDSENTLTKVHFNGYDYYFRLYSSDIFIAMGAGSYDYISMYYKKVKNKYHGFSFVPVQEFNTRNYKLKSINSTYAFVQDYMKGGMSYGTGTLTLFHKGDVYSLNGAVYGHSSSGISTSPKKLIITNNNELYLLWGEETEYYETDYSPQPPLPQYLGKFSLYELRESGPVTLFKDRHVKDLSLVDDWLNWRNKK